MVTDAGVALTTSTWCRRSRGLLALIWLGSAAVVHAEHLPSDRLAVRSLLELRNDGVVRQHWDLSCGAAAVATLLTFQLGDPVSERQAAVGMLHMSNLRLVRARLGFSLLDLKRFAATRGFLAAGYGNLQLDELVAMAPAVAPIRVNGFAHFVVVRGQWQDRVLIADPAFGNRTLILPEFLRAWKSRVGFTVTRPGEPKPPNRMAVSAELPISPDGSALRAAEADIRHGVGR
jgi:predicted double-glycine peptidase